jgi:hypothetical protein
VNLLSGQNLVIAFIGALLLITFASVMQIRVGAPQEEIKVSESENNKNKKVSTLIEPGLYQVQFAEKFAFAPEKILVQLSPGVSAPVYRYPSQDSISNYEISYVRYPDETFQNVNVQKILDDLTQNELNRWQGILKKETTISESINLIKREIEITSNQNNLFVRTMLIISRPYVYLVCFSSKNKNNLYNSKTQFFFTSFKLFEQSAPQTIIVSPNPPKQLEENNNLIPNSSTTNNQEINSVSLNH